MNLASKINIVYELPAISRVVLRWIDHYAPRWSHKRLNFASVTVAESAFEFLKHNGDNKENYSGTAWCGT